MKACFFFVSISAMGIKLAAKATTGDQFGHYWQA
jgi:hypothetical protein